MIKPLFSLLILLFALPVLALTDPMNDDDYEALRKFLTGEQVEIALSQNDRIYPMVKFQAAQQPLELIDLGNTAKKLSAKIAKDGIDNASILQAAAILKMKEASNLKFNSAPHSDAERAALANIEDLHNSLKK